MATILVVDDEQITRQLLHKIIEKRGYKCLLAESAEEARGLAEAERDRARALPTTLRVDKSAAITVRISPTGRKTR